MTRRERQPGGARPLLLMWSLLATLGVMLAAVLVVTRTSGIRVGLEAAAALMALYCAMAGLLTAAQIAAMRDATASQQKRGSERSNGDAAS